MKDSDVALPGRWGGSTHPGMVCVTNLNYKKKKKKKKKKPGMVLDCPFEGVSKRVYNNGGTRSQR
jgi:hypothetical protein